MSCPRCNSSRVSRPLQSVHADSPVHIVRNRCKICKHEWDFKTTTHRHQWLKRRLKKASSAKVIDGLQKSIDIEVLKYGLTDE